MPKVHKRTPAYHPGNPEMLFGYEIRDTALQTTSGEGYTQDQ
jgi:hypothetical protein